MSGLELELVDMEELPMQLLRSWRDNNIATFKKALADGCDVDYGYKEEKYLPILAVISRDPQPDAKKFAEALLATKVDKDKQYMSGKCAIHYAAEVGNLLVLEALLDAKANTNALDQNGSTPLHILVQQKWNKSDAPYRKCMELLLTQTDVEVNAINRRGYTPIHLAVSKNNREAVVSLLEKGSKLDLDNTSVMGVTPRNAILKQYPDLEQELPKDLGPTWSFVKMEASQLFSLLMHKEEERFCDAFEKEIQDKSQRNLLTYDNGKHTFLQYACQENMKNAVEVLLSKGADPNYTPTHNYQSPMDIVARKGLPEILKLLVLVSNSSPPSSPSGATPLHTVAKYCYNSPPHMECLKLILKKVTDGSMKKIHVNSRDCLGNTALHYAVCYGDEEAITEILNHGGYIGAENKQGETPLMKIPPKVLQKFLDDKISHIGAMQDSKERFTFDYSFLAPPKDDEACPEERIPLTGEKEIQMLSKPKPETRPLLLMSQSQDHRHLLTHPVLTSFTFLKWQRIQTFFYVNLLFYVALCLLLTGYILFGYRAAPPLESATDNSISGVLEKPGYHDKTNYTKPDLGSDDEASDGGTIVLTTIRLLIVAFLIVLLFREIFQFAISPKSYLTNLENYLELLLVALASFVVIRDCSQEFSPHLTLGWLCPQFCAIVILISWFELVLLIGKHPLFSVQVEMFRTVSASFIRFLSWYILLIIAFALCFFVLFRGCTGDCSESNPFTNPGTSLFKTLVMLTGEFEAGDIPFVTYIGTSHIIFTAFVFLIAIVLLNLLNGLAVADTKVIRDDAYLYSCVARVKLIAFVEDMLLGDTATFLRPLYSCFTSDTNLKFILLQFFAKKIVFFPSLLPKGQIHVHVEEGNSVEFVDGPQINKDCMSGYYIDSATVRAARDTVAERKDRKILKDDVIGNRMDACSKTIEELAKKLSEFEERFKAIEESNKHIETLLIQNIAIISLNHANIEDR